jgi:hypothetical protein
VHERVAKIHRVGPSFGEIVSPRVLLGELRRRGRTFQSGNCAVSSPITVTGAFGFGTEKYR